MFLTDLGYFPLLIGISPLEDSVHLFYNFLFISFHTFVICSLFIEYMLIKNRNNKTKNNEKHNTINLCRPSIDNK